MLNHFSDGKSKNTSSEIPITPKILNINIWRTMSAKCISVDIIRKLIEKSLKKHFRVIFCLTVFEILLFKDTVIHKTFETNCSVYAK